jgi:chorismate mutase
VADSRLSFLLTGRDELSRVLNSAGDAAQRLQRRLADTQSSGSNSLNRLSRDADGRLRDMQGRFTRAEGAISRSMEAMQASLMSLAPAAIPAAAGVAGALAPVVAQTAAAGAAAAAYAVALGPQVAAMGEATEAEKAYRDAVAESGATSQEAAEAQVAYTRRLAQMPPATQKASVALGQFREQYRAWSDASAEDTVTPVTRAFAVLGAALPKLTPTVRGVGNELDRVVTLAGGAVSTPGFDRMMNRFSEFSTGTIRRANDALVRFMMRLESGEYSNGALAQFMDYARAQGPTVGAALRGIVEALGNLLQAGSEVGVGLLQVVNVLASLVSAVPPGAIAAILQIAIAIRAVKLAAAGLAAVRGALAGVAAATLAMQGAAAGATGGMAAFTAAMATMSRGAKLAVAGTGIGLLLILMSELSQMGQRTPADLDKMTVSLAEFADSGRLTGETARVLGRDFAEFDEALRGLARPDQWDQIRQGINELVGMDSAPVREWKGTLEDVDKALANMVSSGHGQTAAAAFDQLAARARSQGLTTAELRTQLDGYTTALKAQAFEQQLAAQSMGLFGAQAQSVQAKLDAQKASADGLRQSLHALNDTYLQARGDVRAMEAAIDAASEAVKANGRTLSENTEAGRANNAALDAIVSTTMRAAESARANGASWSTVNGIYERGRAALLRTGAQMETTKGHAAALAAQILRTPNKTVMLRADAKDLQAKLTHAKNQLARVPDSRRAEIRARIGQLQAAIAEARGYIVGIDGMTAHTYIYTNHIVTKSTGEARKRRGRTPGGLARGGLIRGPGTSTSDSVPIMASNNEYMVRAAAVKQVGVPFLDALNSGRLGSGDLAGAGAGAGADAGRGLAAGMSSSTTGVYSSARQMAAAVEAGVRAELQIASPSKRMQALAREIGNGLIVGMTGSREKIAATAKRLSAAITAAWAGSKSSVDDRLLAMVAKNTSRLQTLSDQRIAIVKKIAEAREYANTLADSARAGAGLQRLGMDEGEVSAEGIRVGLIAKLDRIQKFAKRVADLGRRGLHKGLLRQILDMGPEAGYEYATALASADAATWSQIQVAQSQIDKAASGMALTGADAMYDAGRQAGRGFLTGLAAQQKDIERLMLDIARGMQAAIRKALGIKSPSRVMAQLGRYSTEGLALGLREQIPVLDRAVGQVAGRVSAARPVMGRPAAVAAGGGAREIRTEIHIHGAMDPVAVGREVQRVLLTLRRTQGINISLGV